MDADDRWGRLALPLRRVNDSVSYIRHLAYGNRFVGDMSWIRTGLPPVVLCHGFLGTRGTMRPLARRFLSDGRIVFTYHHGMFQTQSLRDSAQGLADKLARLRHTLGVEQFDVVGFSMGGVAALHAVKLLGAHEHIRRLVLLGAPVRGIWTATLAIAAMGMTSSSVWQLLPSSSFIQELHSHPMPEGLEVRQIQARDDLICLRTRKIEGVRDENYCVLPGGHASLVVARHIYENIREFLDQDLPVTITQDHPLAP